jgi:hypothetical protein
MKRLVFFVVIGVVALFAAATDRLYMEDFTIQAGKTVQVSLILENSTQYTAFQTDLYLPEGLSIEKEDGDYAFELTSRKSRDHVIVSHDMPDGAIRIMSYSMNVNPFSGNDGALVTFNITASDAFTEDAIIELKNTLFTNMNDQELTFNDETCTVTQTATSLRGDVDDNGSVNISDVTALIDYLLTSNANGISLDGADCDQDGSINISDVTSLIDYLLTGHWSEP